MFRVAGDLDDCNDPIIKITSEVIAELRDATQRFGAFNSTHEGIAVILEEYRELESEVFKKQKDYDMSKMRKEAIQLAAMAIRYVMDLCGDEDA